MEAPAPKLQLWMGRRDTKPIDCVKLGEEQPESIEQYELLIRKAYDKERRSLTKATHRLKTLREQPTKVWSFFDFLYFSTITQTTVGYGDILPNSTIVRMIVATQITSGVVLLAVVINRAFGS